MCVCISVCGGLKRILLQRSGGHWSKFEDSKLANNKFEEVLSPLKWPL